MKKLVLLFLFYFLSFCFIGCSSINSIQKDFYIDVQEYIELNGNKCLEYIEADSNMTNREKEMYKIRHRYLQSQVNKKLQK